MNEMSTCGERKWSTGNGSKWIKCNERKWRCLMNVSVVNEVR